jgi:hypothetical protein
MRTFRRLIQVAALAAAGVVSAAASAHAGTVTVTSSSAFSAAASGLSTTGFNSIGTGGAGTGPLAIPTFYNVPGDSLTLNSITFASSNSGENINSASYYDQFPPTIDITNQYLVNGFPPVDSTLPLTLTITLPSEVTAFALDFSALFADTTATFTLSNGFSTSVVANDFSAPNLGTQFLGFLSTTPFNTITLSVPAGDTSWVVEDVTTGTANAVPEPSTWALLLTGFLGIALVARRQATRLRSKAA